jgi:hypothetical protein
VQVSKVARHSTGSINRSIYVPPTGFEPALTAPEAAVAGWRICALASRDAAVAVLTAKIVPHMFRIMLTGVLPRTPVLLIIPARGQAGWRTCHRSFNGI